MIFSLRKKDGLKKATSPLETYVSKTHDKLRDYQSIS